MTHPSEHSTAEPERRRRILIGTTEVADQVYQLGEGFRTLGHAVTTVVNRPHPFYPATRYDVLFEPKADDTPTRLSRSRRTARRLRRLPRLIRDHDTFVFVSGATLVRRAMDIPLLALLGRDIIFIFLGSDVRHWEATEQHRAAVGLGSHLGYRNRPASEAVRLLRIAELFGQVTFLQPSYAEAAIAPYMHASLAMDVGKYRFSVPDGDDPPVVVHAPSRRAVKGTTEILAALDRLRSTGVDFDLQLLEGRPNAEVLDALVHADVLVDQISESNYGLLALEAMASGCAVLGGNRPDIVPTPPNRPVIHLTLETLDETIRHVLSDRDARVIAAHDGRSYVQAHHERSRVAAAILRDLERATSGDHDYTPTYFATEYRPDQVRATSAERLLTWLVGRRRGVPRRLRAGLRQQGLSY